MKISNSTFVYYNYSLADAIVHTAEAGFDGVDIWGGRPHAYRRDLSRQEKKSLRRLLDSLNVQVASLIPAQFRYPTCLCSNNQTIRRDSVAFIQESIETASELGAPIVSVCPGHSLHGQDQQDAWQRLSESLNAICEFAFGYGIRIAIEPADHYETDLMNTTAAVLPMIDQLGHSNLGVLLDNGHAYVVGESVPDAVRNLGESLFHVHVDDNDGRRDQHLIPGEGSFEFDSMIEALRNVGYQGFLSAELGWEYTLDPDAAVRTTCRRLREMV